MGRITERTQSEILSTDKAAHYGESAHLFVYELMRLKNGATGLRKMLEALPEHPNWQIAFMRGFESNLPQILSIFEGRKYFSRINGLPHVANRKAPVKHLSGMVLVVD